MSGPHHQRGGGGVSGEVAAALGQYETRAANLLQRLGQLAEHLRQVQASPNLVHPDWPAIVTHFRVTEHQLEQLGRDVQPFLQYFVLGPQARPPPQADVPLMLSTRSLVDMEAAEAQLQAAFWERPDPPVTGDEGGDGVEGLIAGINEAVERVGLVCDWQLAEFKDAMKAFKSPGLEGVPGWRRAAEPQAERAFAWLEARVDGRLPLAQQQQPQQSQQQARGR